AENAPLSIVSPYATASLRALRRAREFRQPVRTGLHVHCRSRCCAVHVRTVQICVRLLRVHETSVLLSAAAYVPHGMPYHRALPPPESAAGPTWHRRRHDGFCAPHRVAPGDPNSRRSCHMSMQRELAVPQAIQNLSQLTVTDFDFELDSLPGDH